jgi:hypothetical protein
VAVELRAAFESPTVGVGSNFTAALGSIKSPDDPRWFGPPFVPSVARGVGSNFTATFGND